MQPVQLVVRLDVSTVDGHRRRSGRDARMTATDVGRPLVVRTAVVRFATAAGRTAVHAAVGRRAGTARRAPAGRQHHVQQIGPFLWTQNGTAVIHRVVFLCYRLKKQNPKSKYTVSRLQRNEYKYTVNKITTERHAILLNTDCQGDKNDSTRQLTK